MQRMKHFSHLNTATEVIRQYGGSEPLHYFLKKFFSGQKKFGSKDRKRITHLCYTFYRVARAMETPPSPGIEIIQEIIMAGLFLCSNESDELLGVVKPSWNKKINSSENEKAAMINTESELIRLDLNKVFPAADVLSDNIDVKILTISHLYQPDLFIRIRPGNIEAALKKVQQLELPHEFIPPSAIRFPNGIKVDEIFSIDREVVIQDLSSQRIAGFLKFFIGAPGGTSVWDCCGASGGKSILAKDILGNIKLTVSDIRESILVNLRKRFAAAGITGYRDFVADLTSGRVKLPTEHFDLLIADLPCTGSGTWGRTPEQLYFFQPSSIERYSALQKQILVNVVPQMKQTGKLLYTTCSVFKQENEEIVDFLLQRFPLKVEKMEVLRGYDTKADTMFGALLSYL